MNAPAVCQRPWLLVDLSYLAYRALHSMHGLTHDDVPTGVLFGFFSQLRTLCEHKLIQSNRVAIFCDSKTSVRKKKYLAYKHKRNERTDEERELLDIMLDQRTLLRKEILPKIGFPVYIQPGLESDDLIASAAHSLSAKLDNPLFPERYGVMITADNDLYQCITRTVHWFDPQRNLYFDPKSFEEEKGVTPGQWATVKSIAGCRGDNVKGVPGIGEASAIAYVRGVLPEHHARHRAIESKDGLKRIKRTAKLVVLPHAETTPVELEEPEYNPEAFFSFAKQYGMGSFTADEKGWRAFFREPRTYNRKIGARRRG
jgi:5'-3' exonuclease